MSLLFSCECGSHVLQCNNVDEGEDHRQVWSSDDAQGENKDALSDRRPRGETHHHWRHVYERAYILVD